MVAERLAEACATLRRMRGNDLVRIGALRALWPDAPADPWLAYASDRDTPVRPAAPSPEEIRRCDEALGWLLWIDGRSRKVVMGRACGASWRRLQALDGRCETTLKRVVIAAAVTKIVARLTGKRL